MKSMNLAAFMCLALVITPVLGDAARGLNSSVENISRTLQASERIAYGQAAYYGQFPFMVRLARTFLWGILYTHNCGGTVISPNYILTAAHCLYDEYEYKPPNTVLLGGTVTSSLDNFSEKIAVAQVLFHPQYQHNTNGASYDVAILRLKSPTSYPAVKLASSAPSNDTVLTSMGWGYTESGNNLSDRLLYTTVKVGTHGVAPCPACLVNPCTVLCEVGFRQSNGQYTSTCGGDSGGPQLLADTTTQVSIVSFGPKACGTDAYSFSTSVADPYIRSWINSIAGGEISSPTPPPIPPSGSMSVQTITYTSRYSTLLMTYDGCQCGASRVWGAFKGNGGKPESQIWSVTQASSPGRYYIRAEVSRSCTGQFLYLTSPALSSEEYADGVLQVPYLAEQGSRQEWILQTTQGSTTIRSASRLDSRDPYSYLGMSIDPLDDMFMVFNIEASDYTYSISSYTQPLTDSCAGPAPVPSPSPVPTPIPSPSPVPSPLPSPEPTPSPSPVPQPQPKPSPAPSRRRPPPSRRKPPPSRRRPPPARVSGRKPPPARSPLRKPPPRRPPPVISPPLLPSPPPPSLSPPAPVELISPGIDFILIIPGFDRTTFGNAQQTALCGAITSGWTSGASCTVSSIYQLESTGVFVSGYAYFTFTDVPTLIQLQTAASQRDDRVAALTTNTNSVLGGLYPGAVPNCACKGYVVITTSSTDSFTYSNTLGNVPGPMQCGAKLTYDNSIANAFISQVGVDDGALIPSNVGKYCSTPAVNGGVPGIPGSGSCRQYGVLAGQAGIVSKLCSPNPIISLSASISSSVPTAITFDGVCRPLGRNTYLNQVCSTPAAPGGVSEFLNMRNCNVQSSFIPQPGSATSSSCGILPQGFAITVGPTS